MNNQRCLNILRSAVLKQCYNENMDVIQESSELTRHYIYGYGSGTSSVGMEPYNFFTSKMTYEIKYIVTELHELLLHNKSI